MIEEGISFRDTKENNQLGLQIQLNVISKGPQNRAKTSPGFLLE